MRVNTFTGKYAFLSNFHMCEVEYEGMKYPSVEHAYQAAKTLDLNDRRTISLLPFPVDAKRAGRLVVLREDWDGIKNDVMWKLLLYKFTIHHELGWLLISTENMQLVEVNYWHDNYWGYCTCDMCSTKQHHNVLGKILMQVRTSLRGLQECGEWPSGYNKKG